MNLKEWKKAILAKFLVLYWNLEGHDKPVEITGLRGKN
jgi:hypothetical protein